MVEKEKVVDQMTEDRKQMTEGGAMRFKSTLIMAAVLLLLGLYVRYIDLPQTEKKKKEKELSEKIIPFEKEEVEEFTISYDHTRITMKTGNGHDWDMTSPVQAKGDKKTADGIVSRLHAATFSRIVDDNPGDLAVYGLDKPEVTISLTIKGEEKIIIVGDTSPLKNGVYVKRGWDTPVLLAGTYIRDDVKKSTHDLRDKKVITVEKEEIKEIQIESKGRLIALSRNENEWSMSAPVQAKGDTDEINKLIIALKNLIVKEFIDESPDDLQKYGLKSPQIFLHIFTGKDKTQKTLVIGKKYPTGYYAKQGENKNVFLIEKDDVKDIFYKDTDDLRDKTLFQFNRDEIERIELEYPDERIILQRGEKTEWNISEPVHTQGNEVAVARLLANLEDVKVKRFIYGNVKKTKKYGQDKPKIRIILWKKGNESKSALSIGRFDTELDGHISFLTEIDIPVVLAPADVDALSMRLFDLRDRRLISFKENEVEKIEIKYADKTFFLERKGEKWKMTKPEKADASEVKIRTLLWNLRDIEFKKIIPDPSNRPDTYGLDKPSIEITLWQKDRKDADKLLIGNKLEQEDLVYAQNNKTDHVYGIPQDIIKKIPEEKDDLLE